MLHKAEGLCVKFVELRKANTIIRMVVFIRAVSRKASYHTKEGLGPYNYGASFPVEVKSSDKSPCTTVQSLGLGV